MLRYLRVACSMCQQQLEQSKGGGRDWEGCTAAALEGHSPPAAALQADYISDTVPADRQARTQHARHRGHSTAQRIQHSTAHTAPPLRSVILLLLPLPRLAGCYILAPCAASTNSRGRWYCTHSSATASPSASGCCCLLAAAAARGGGGAATQPAVSLASSGSTPAVAGRA